MATVLGPPRLMGEGKKVQSAWLFEFLHAPETIRPWIQVRMPTYKVSDSQRNALARYFSALDTEPFPFAAETPPDPAGPLFAAGKQLFSKDYFDCANCHIQGDKFPEGEADRWAPDFALSARRLKPAWVKQWLYDPQALEPGTKMPTYFDPEYFDDAGPEDVLGGDEHQHILAIRDYVLGIALDVPPTEAPPAANTPEESETPLPPREIAPDDIAPALTEETAAAVSKPTAGEREPAAS